MFRADRDQILAFRLDGHNLGRRQPSSALPAVAAACGLRNSPPGSALLAAHARIDGLPPDALERALANQKTLVEVLGMRISPHLVPVGDVSVFTLGALPATEESLLAVLSSLAPALKEAGMTATEALRLAAEAAWDALDGQMLERGAFSAVMTGKLPEVLCPWCKGCAARHVQEGLFRLVGVRGIFVIAVRPDRGRVYARADQWLDVVLTGDEAAARAELLRRYLRCFGPSTVEHFAAWVGITAADARRSWNRMEDSLIPVETSGRRAWLHRDDLSRLDAPAIPSGVRLLPPYDSYLDQRDREMLLPDKTAHPRIWRVLGNPGVVLADGQVVGLWRPQKKGKCLALTVEALAPISWETRAQIEAEAALLAPYRGCAFAAITFAE
ncbi:MAG TPA: winged helix DNA-binding domain-containing protein [Chloroflexota bacterium]|nr:winged helix DNA-binding domain-containing protein [Chloroflexota bacterium]